MENRLFIRHYKNRLNLPSALTVTVLAICVIPAIIVLPQLGVNNPADLKYTNYPPSGGNLSNFLLYHTWLIFGIVSCFIAGGLALAHYALRKEASGLTAGVALAITGLYDVFYSLPYDVLPTQDFSDGLYSRWLISRLLHVSILVASTFYFIFNANKSIRENNKDLPFLIFTYFLFFTAAVALTAFLKTIPGLHNKNQFITHPYELLTLSIYLILGSIILPHSLQKFASPFSGIIIISIIPSAFAGVFMAIHREDFDVFFNAAYFLRATGYLTPLAGIVLNYIHAIKKEKQIAEHLRTQKLASLRTWKNLEERESSLAKAGADLERKVEELKRSNQELEQFAYVASHDIQEPLRKIKAFSDLIERDYGNSLPDQAQDYIARMRKAAERLQLLIDNILSLSRARKSANELVMVDLKEVINDVLSDLEYIIEKKNARIGVKVDMQLRAIPVQMRQLFQNLISNALKFSRPEVPPLITIEAIYIDGEELKNRTGDINPQALYCRIEIIDNGIGFDKQDAEKIFNLFQRLHSRTEYEGTGLGLALCKKITENHLGYIEAEGEEGNGAKIRVYLPC